MVMQDNCARILQQRDRLIKELPKIPGIGRFQGGLDSNFLLVEILDRPEEEGGKPSNPAALTAYENLAEQKGVVVRFRGKEYGCEGCLRITVGTEKEVDRFLEEIASVLRSIYTSKEHRTGESERVKEEMANDIVA